MGCLRPCQKIQKRHTQKRKAQKNRGIALHSIEIPPSEGPNDFSGVHPGAQAMGVRSIESVLIGIVHRLIHQPLIKDDISVSSTLEIECAH